MYAADVRCSPPSSVPPFIIHKSFGTRSSTHFKGKHTTLQRIMPPRSIFDASPHRVCNDVSSSNSTFSAVTSAKSPISPPASKPRTLSFRDQAEVKDTIHCSEYTEEEKAASWFNSDDYTRMRVERKTTVRLMERGDPLVNDGRHYYRGLEGKTREGSCRKQFNSIDASLAVLDEQNRLAQLGASAAAEVLSKIYISCTAHCIASAHERGLVDQRAALESVSIAVPPASRRLQPRRLSCQAA
jgi:hypothetical protein